MFAAILPFLPTIAELVGGLVQKLTGDKGDKVIDIIKHALGGSAVAAQSLIKIKDMLKSGSEPSDAELDGIVADIKANSQTIHDLAQAARDRDA